MLHPGWLFHTAVLNVAMTDTITKECTLQTELMQQLVAKAFRDSTTVNNLSMRRMIIASVSQSMNTTSSPTDPSTIASMVVGPRYGERSSGCPIQVECNPKTSSALQLFLASSDQECTTSESAAAVAYFLGSLVISQHRNPQNLDPPTTHIPVVLDARGFTSTLRCRSLASEI